MSCPHRYHEQELVDAITRRIQAWEGYRARLRWWEWGLKADYDDRLDRLKSFATTLRLAHKLVETANNATKAEHDVNDRVGPKIPNAFTSIHATYTINDRPATEDEIKGLQAEFERIRHEFDSLLKFGWWPK